MKAPARILAALAALALTPTAGAAEVTKTQGVFVTLASALKSPLAETAAKAEAALAASGFSVLANVENGVPAGCRFRSRTLVFAKDAFTAEVLSAGPEKSFGLPLRLSLFENEAGVSVALANPVSLLRTFTRGNGKDAAAQKLVDEVAAALAPLGPIAPKPAGELRESGEIGGMGGGAFPDRIVHVVTVGRTPAETAEKLRAGIADAAGWRSIYALKVSDDVFVVGVTNPKTEGRAFGIAGEKRASKADPFPGIDHAAAFPIEIVVTKKGDATSVAILKEMWRMKLYFQDAGNWAFMKNMAMPGDIQEEIERAVRRALE